MPKRLSTPEKTDHDAHTRSKKIIGQIIEETEEPVYPTPIKKNVAAVALGRLGGLKGGKARALKLSAERKTEIARKAAETRWAKKS